MSPRQHLSGLSREKAPRSQQPAVCMKKHPALPPGTFVSHIHTMQPFLLSAIPAGTPNRSQSTITTRKTSRGCTLMRYVHERRYFGSSHYKEYLYFNLYLVPGTRTYWWWSHGFSSQTPEHLPSSPLLLSLSPTCTVQSTYDDTITVRSPIGGD